MGDEAESKTAEEEEEFEANIAGSEEMELSIALILEKIENYTQRVAVFSYTRCEAWNRSV